jgi:hypothetical protein
MGSASSVPVRPRNFPEDKWKKLQSMFDDIDSNSNFHIDKDDTVLPVAMELHVKKIAEEDKKWREKKRVMDALENERRQDFEKELEIWRAGYEKEVNLQQTYVRNLREKNSQQIRESFLKDMAPSGGKISFDVFFQFMKDKV